MKLLRSLAFLSLFVFSACSSTVRIEKPVVDQAPPPVAAKGDTDSVEDKVTQLNKETRKKERELSYASASRGTSGLERQLRTMTCEAEVHSAELALVKAQTDLEQHLKETAPRELEEHRMRLDQQTYRAEEAKDELAELESMYEADEFAKATKELVIKRGRRQMEMADRGLAIARREFVEFESHTMPQQERELRQKLADAERAREKARLEIDKMRLEQELAARQEDDRTNDLQEEANELRQKLEKAMREATGTKEKAITEAAK
jgi:hypothetical protein